MHQKGFGGRALPGPAGGAYSAPPDPRGCHQGVLLLREGRDRDGEGSGDKPPLSKSWIRHCY